MRSKWLFLVLFFPVLCQCQTNSRPAAGSALLEQFLTTGSPEAGEQLVNAAGDTMVLYQWFRQGPDYSTGVPRGDQHRVRIAADGTGFPYALLVPQDYDPATRYPVEFHLHGGVSRAEWQPGETLWRRGYDSLRNPARIIVIPAAWNEAFWWFSNQAENLPGILNEVKQTYNVDENRAYLSGVSDGGTGAYFFAFMQPTEWAAFMPYIGHPGVLRNPAGRETHSLFIENLTGKPLYIVNGEEDPLYPAVAVRPYIEAMEQAGVEHVFKAVFDGGHNTDWMPDEAPAIAAFTQSSRRDPLPENIQWLTLRTDRYNRNHWIRIDELEEEGRPGRLIVEREGNAIDVTAHFLNAFTLLLNPEEIDFSNPVVVRANGEIIFDAQVEPDAGTLLEWAYKDQDRTMLFTAQLNLRVPE
ncbi:MAG: hypothetical protein WDZ76_14210 [Pseudohongiellaceae bacterium]